MKLINLIGAGIELTCLVNAISAGWHGEYAAGAFWIGCACYTAAVSITARLVRMHPAARSIWG